MTSPLGGRYSGWFTRIVDSVLLLLVVLMAVTLLRREFGGRSSAASRISEAGAYSPIADSSSSEGRLLGSPQAVARFLVFNDLECPFCARFHETLRAAEGRHGESISIQFVHFPLNSHRFAKPAALAAECAGVSGKFVPMVDLIFSKQDSLGLVSWRHLATEAGIVNLDAFDRCVEQGVAQFSVIDDGLRFGRSLNVAGTPTIYLNGWKLSVPPDSVEIDRMVAKLRAGKPPFS